MSDRFTDNTRRARYGVAYIRTLCAQAGVGFSETSPDEDVFAIDGTIKFGRASANVQVKCSGQFVVKGAKATLDLEPSWVARWAEDYEPMYVVLVKVDKSIPNWIGHPTGGTHHKATAFWTRFDKLQHTEKMVFTSAQRLTVDTLYDWRDEVYAYHEKMMGNGS